MVGCLLGLPTLVNVWLSPTERYCCSQMEDSFQFLLKINHLCNKKQSESGGATPWFKDQVAMFGRCEMAGRAIIESHPLLGYTNNQ
jgi:hypothetical protein